MIKIKDYRLPESKGFNYTMMALMVLTLLGGYLTNSTGNPLFMLLMALSLPVLIYAQAYIDEPIYNKYKNNYIKYLDQYKKQDIMDCIINSNTKKETQRFLLSYLEQYKKESDTLHS